MYMHVYTPNLCMRWFCAYMPTLSFSLLAAIPALILLISSIVEGIRCFREQGTLLLQWTLSRLPVHSRQLSNVDARARQVFFGWKTAKPDWSQRNNSLSLLKFVSELVPYTNKFPLFPLPSSSELDICECFFGAVSKFPKSSGKKIKKIVRKMEGILVNESAGKNHQQNFRGESETILTKFIKEDKTRGRPRFLFFPGTIYCTQDKEHRQQIPTSLIT